MLRNHAILGRVAAVFTALCLGYVWWHWEWEHERTVRFVSAAAQGNTPTVQAFLNSGVRPDAQSFHQPSALQRAVSYGHTDTVRLLLEKGADPNKALRSATHKGGTPILTMLLDKGAKVQGRAGASALVGAVKSGELASVRLLLRKGADMNTPDEYGMLAIQQAASSGSWDVFCTLVDHGADVTARSPQGITVLMYAAGGENADAARICRYLIRHGVNVNAKDDGGKTALIHSVYFDREDSPDSLSRMPILEALFQSGAEVDAQDKYGRTALHYATEFRSSKAKARLCQAGATLL